MLWILRIHFKANFLGDWEGLAAWGPALFWWDLGGDFGVAKVVKRGRWGYN